MAEREDGPGTGQGSEAETGFHVDLDNFRGPFEVLLGLISKHELDITEIALAQVTDEFIAYVQGLDTPNALDETSEFLVVAATLLDLKAARLLPRGEVEDQEDVARLEARDMLFAKLLQYKAYKEAASLLREQLRDAPQIFARQVSLDEQLAQVLPSLVWALAPQDFAELAQRSLVPKPREPEQVSIEHLHAAPVSVSSQARILANKLKDHQTHTFAELVADAGGLLVVVVRFLALLDMYRDAVVDVAQEEPLAELAVCLAGAVPENGRGGRESGVTGVDAVEAGVA